MSDVKVDSELFRKLVNAVHQCDAIGPGTVDPEDWTLEMSDAWNKARSVVIGTAGAIVLMWDVEQREVR